MMKSVRIKVYGRVQNVGFRYFAIKEAEKHGMNGFVKNESDGSVLIEAEGEEINLDKFILEIKQGPNWARVEQAIVNPIPSGNYNFFSAKY